MENSISKRIELILSEFNMNKNSFSKAIGVTNNVTIGRIINENRSPSYDIIVRILQTFGSIDANWLLLGEGQMYKTKNQNLSFDQNSDFIDFLKNQIHSKDMEISKLLSIIESFKNESKSEEREAG